jgi:hypothetical protein
MPWFRKRPVEFEAEQFWPDRQPLPFADRGACCLGPDGWYVVTAHGQETKIVAGDWIVPEPDGRGFYPVKPDIMEKFNEQIELRKNPS